MATSQNGWLANDRSVITSYAVTKDDRKVALRVGPAGEMLADIVRWFDENVRDIDPGILDEWGYAERPIRGGVSLSNHASGTAVDVQATKWPLGAEASDYLTAAEIAKVQAKLKEYRGCIRWGANYTGGRTDPMHFEVDADEATVTQVWADVQAARAAKEPSPIVRAMQNAMRYTQLGKEQDGYWGPTTDKDVYAIRQASYGHAFPFNVNSVQKLIGTEPTGTWAPEDEVALAGVVAVFQRAWGIEDDGIWGPMTERTWKSYQTRLYS